MNYYPLMATALGTIVLITGTLNCKLGKLIHDIPNERSLHTDLIPRTGGLGLMAGILIGFGLAWQSWFLPTVIGALFLMLVSFLDDLRGLSASWRFVTHFIVVGTFIWATIPPTYGWLAASVLAVAMVWMINLYNFMDGADGLAGGMTLFGFGGYALAAGVAGDMVLATLSGCVAVSGIAFLIFNFYPARIFLGDAGSIPLGFLAAALGLLGWMNGIWPLWFPLLVFAPFIVDASITLAKRVFAREKVWQAHRSHYYQRLILMGWGHKRTALAEYMLMIASGSTAVLMLEQPSYIQGCGLLLWGVVYGVLMLWVDVQWGHQKRRQSDDASTI